MPANSEPAREHPAETMWQIRARFENDGGDFLPLEHYFDETVARDRLRQLRSANDYDHTNRIEFVMRKVVITPTGESYAQDFD